MLKATAVLLLWACASAPVGPESKVVELAPYASHVECLQLKQGARIDYRFESTEPISFDIRYRDGAAVLLPIAREAAVEDAGIYPVPFTREFCLAWEAGAARARLAYRWRIRPPP